MKNTCRCSNHYREIFFFENLDSNFVRAKGLLISLSQPDARVSPVSSIEVLCISGRITLAGIDYLIKSEVYGFIE